MGDPLAQRVDAVAGDLKRLFYVPYLDRDGATAERIGMSSRSLVLLHLRDVVHRLASRAVRHGPRGAYSPPRVIRSARATASAASARRWPDRAAGYRGSSDRATVLATSRLAGPGEARRGPARAAIRRPGSPFVP